MGTFRYVGLPVLHAKAMGALVAATTQSAEDFVGRSQDNTPVGPTGNLKAGQHVVGVVVLGNVVIATIATGGEANEYAIFVHDGTTKMAARPFMAQALMDNVGAYLEAMRRAVAAAF